MVEKVIHQRTVDQRVKKKEKDAANPKTSDTEEACKQTGSLAIISPSEV